MLPQALRRRTSQETGRAALQHYPFWGIFKKMLSVLEVDFHRRLGHLLTTLNGPRFWPALSEFLREAAPFDSWVSMIFRSGRPPELLHKGYNSGAQTNLFPVYMQELYILDPFYSFALAMRAAEAPAANPGLYRLDEVAPEHFRRTEYYHRYFARVVGADEVQLLVPMADAAVLSLSLGRGTRFQSAEIGALSLYVPWLLPLVQHATAAERVPLSPESARADRDQRVSALEDRLRSRGPRRLTDREVQTALRILAGYSTKGIASELELSPETVKVHRRNLYEKLGVSTQAALFAMFLSV